MTTNLLLLLSLCLPGTHPLDGLNTDLLKPLPPRVYAVNLQGRQSGYCVEQCTFSALDGRLVMVFASRTALRTGPSGPDGSGTSIFDATYWVDPVTSGVWRARFTVRQGKTFETREAEFNNGRVTFRVITPEGAQPSREITLPEKARVPFGLAFPALHLLESERSEASLTLFRMRDGKVHTLEIRREGGETIEYHDRTYSCQRMSVQEDNRLRPATLWITEEGELVKMELPAEGMIFEPAKPDVAGKIGSAPSKFSAFAPVENKISNRAALMYLSMEAMIDSPGLEDAALLNTANQSFEGTLNEGRIAGTFEIRSTYYGGGQGQAIPAGPEEADVLAAWLAQAAGVESAHPLIRKRAGEITADLRQRWHAAHALGVWVRKNISIDQFGGPGALEALEQGSADLKGIARLHVALCRSLGIPARLVEGGIYLKAGEGGGFANHTWSEVHMGTDGWIPMDTAMGELNFLDAGHLRMGTAGAFRPVRLKILDYIPKPAENREPVEAARTDFPLAAGEVHRFAHYFDDKLLGIERITFVGEEPVEGGKAFRFTSELELDTVKSKATTLAASDGRLQYYKADSKETQRTYRAEGEAVLCERIIKGKSDKSEAALPREGFFFDNQQVFHLGFLVSRLSLEEGRPLQVDVFHLLGRRILPIQAERLDRRIEDIQGRRMEVDVVELRSGFQRMILYMADSGLVVKELEQGGRSVVVWLGPDKE
jgi:hypothetical protein